MQAHIGGTLPNFANGTYENQRWSSAVLLHASVLPFHPPFPRPLTPHALFPLSPNRAKVKPACYAGIHEHDPLDHVGRSLAQQCHDRCK